jgi:hypothetical protein
VRTRAGLAKLDGDRSGFDASLADELQREISVRGPLLAEIKEDSMEYVLEMLEMKITGLVPS